MIKDYFTLSKYQNIHIAYIFEGSLNRHTHGTTIKIMFALLKVIDVSKENKNQLMQKVNENDHKNRNLF